MTTCLSISAGHATEAPALPFTPTPMVQRFAFMQAALALYLDAERYLTQSGAWDPACDHWLRDAEAARTALAAALDAVCATGPARAQDRPLRQLARIARVMLLATDEAEFAQLRDTPAVTLDGQRISLLTNAGLEAGVSLQGSKITKVVE